MPVETTVAMLKSERRPVTTTMPVGYKLPVRTLPFPRVLPAAASGLLLWVCFFPVAWGWLAWVALVPLLCLVRNTVNTDVGPNPKLMSLAGRLLQLLRHPSLRVFLCACLGALVFYVPVLQWMRVGDSTMYLAWLVVSVYCTLFVAVGVVVVRWIDRRTGVPLVLSFPATWCALEYFRTHLGEGFPWYFLGHTQHAVLAMVQISDMTGVYGVSFLIAAVNVIVFELLSRRTSIRNYIQLAPARFSVPWLVAQVTGVVLLVAGTLVYGCWRLGYDSFEVGPTISLVQGNLKQEVKNYGKRRDILEHYRKLGQRAAQQEPKPDLVVWPETSFPGSWEEVDVAGAPGLDSELAKSLPQHAASRLNREQMQTAYEGGVPLLLGTEAVHLDKQLCFNSAVLLTPTPRRTSLVEGFAVRSEDFIVNHDTKRTDPIGVFRLVKYDAPGGLKAHDAAPIGRGQELPANADAVVLGSEKRCIPLGNDIVELDTRFEPGEEFGAYSGQNLVRFSGRYDKMHLVPLGEYVPFKKWTSLLQKFTPYSEDYGVDAGENFTRFEIQDRAGRSYHFGVVICYEDTDPCLARQYVAPGSQAVDFMVNISNDGWFKGTAEHEQHLALARFRAIECRRSLVRSVNMGISAVIDPNGRVLAPKLVSSDEQGAMWKCTSQDYQDLPTSRWSDFKKVAGVLTVEVPIDSRETVYARWGDWFAWACWGVVVLGVVWALVTWARASSSMSPSAAA